MKYLEIEDLILINQYVQNIITKDNINSWFLSFDESDKQIIVRTIWQLAVQSRVNDNDVLIATNAARLKSTHTPVVMLHSSKFTLWQRGGDLAKLRGQLLNQAFYLVLECLATADRRRREEENKTECTHWWHRDLTDKKIIDEIIKNRH